MKQFNLIHIRNMWKYRWYNLKNAFLLPFITNVLPKEFSIIVLWLISLSVCMCVKKCRRRRKKQNQTETEKDTTTSDANSKRPDGIDTTKYGKDSGTDDIQDNCTNDVNTVTSQNSVFCSKITQDTTNSDASSKRPDGIDTTKYGKDSGTDDIQSNCTNDANTVTSQNSVFCSKNTQKVTTSIYSNGSVFVLVLSDDISKFVEEMLRDIKLNITMIKSVDAEAYDENRSIIIARNAGNRIDSDIAGCCEDLKDSVIQRTVVVIINGFGDYAKNEHGKEKPPKFEMIAHKYKKLKGIVSLNFDCFQKRDACKKCLNARQALLYLVI